MMRSSLAFLLLLVVLGVPGCAETAPAEAPPPLTTDPAFEIVQPLDDFIFRQSHDCIS